MPGKRTPEDLPLIVHTNGNVSLTWKWLGGVLIALCAFLMNYTMNTISNSISAVGNKVDTVSGKVDAIQSELTGIKVQEALSDQDRRGMHESITRLYTKMNVKEEVAK